MTRLAETVTGEHRIVLRMNGSLIGLSCACLRVGRRGRPSWDFIDMRPLFPAAEVIAAWRDWHAGRGITP